MDRAEQSSGTSQFPIDSVGAYLALRERGVTQVGEAVWLFSDSGRPSVAEFDAIADGLYLFELELEDEQVVEHLTLATVEVINELASFEERNDEGCLTAGWREHVDGLVSRQLR